MKLLSEYTDSFKDVAKYTSWSLYHCHAKDLYSIVLEKNPDGSLLRMFYAAPNHDLWRNGFNTTNQPAVEYNEPLGLAVHSHHCDITIMGVSGTMKNNICKLWSDRDKTGIPSIHGQSKQLTKYKYTSSILNGKKKAKFVPCGEERVMVDTVVSIEEGNFCKMSASEMHTVYVKKGETAAWLIYEGKEDPNYTSVCYSNDNLEQFPFEDYYLPVDETTVAKILWEQRLLAKRSLIPSYKCGVYRNVDYYESIEWWEKGVNHRVGGPAIIIPSRVKHSESYKFILDGNQYSEQDYWNHPLMVEYRLNTIANIKL